MRTRPTPSAARPEQVEGNLPLLWLRADVTNVSLLALGGGFTALAFNDTFPSDFHQATPSGIRVDAGARGVSLALLQDHGYGSDSPPYWPPKGGGCTWGHHYPFPGEAIPFYPFWTYPNRTMWVCWYGSRVSCPYWGTVSSAYGLTRGCDKPVLWRLG